MIYQGRQIQSLYTSNIKRRRKELNLTQADVGRRLGLTKSTISRIESGQIEATDCWRLADLCNVLSVSPEYFYIEHK